MEGNINYRNQYKKYLNLIVRVLLIKIFLICSLHQDLKFHLEVNSNMYSTILVLTAEISPLLKILKLDFSTADHLGCLIYQFQFKRHLRTFSIKKKKKIIMILKR